MVGRPEASGRPSARLAHWTACPLAPFTRLSMAQRDTTHPVRGSAQAVTWAVFDPNVAFVDGDDSLTTTNGSSSYAACSASSTRAVETVAVGRASQVAGIPRF